jgi:signal transduction histidine kinase
VSQPTAGAAVTRNEFALVLAGLLYRVYALTHVIASLVSGWGAYLYPRAALAVGSVIVVESLAVAAICAARRRLVAWVISVDTAVAAVALGAGSHVTWARAGGVDTNFMYTYTLIASVAVGFAYRRYRHVLVAVAALSVAYLVANLAESHESVAATIPNVLGYLTNTSVAFVFAGYLRRQGLDLDASRAQALARAEALARERERVRHARMLHDRVLQTLEAMGRGDLIPDRDLRARVAAEAAWLRALVGGGDSEHDDDLLAGLQRLVATHAREGLLVELNTAHLQASDAWRSRLSAERTDALVAATHEALTNVSKHSGVSHAVVRAGISADELTVSIVDRGQGFDPTHAGKGLGVAGSIQGRLADVGGTARLESAPGQGTVVDLTVGLVGQMTDSIRPA